MCSSHTTAGEERRAHTRRLLNMDIDVRADGQSTLRCTLRDLGPRGLTLDRSDASAGLMLGMKVQLGLRIPPNAEEGYYRVMGRVVHTGAAGIGLALLEAPLSFTRVLESYLQSLDKRDALSQIKRRQALEQSAAWRAHLRHAAIGKGNLMGLVDRLLEQGLASLRGKALSSVSDAERGQWEDDAARLDLACRERGLSHSISSALLHSLQSTLDAQRTGVGETRVMDDAHAGLWLARQFLVESLEGALAVQLVELRNRMHPIIGDSSILPLSPDAFADVLEEELNNLNLSLEARIFLLRSAAAPLLNALPLFYRRLIEPRIPS